jgi:ankyrin repeat protein
MEAKMKRVLVVFLVLVFAVTLFAEDKNAELFDAVKNGDLAYVQKLISKGADVNAKDNIGMTPLMAAAEEGRKDVCELLISKGADINAQDKDGKTALKYAIENSKNDVADFLRSKGATE